MNQSTKAGKGYLAYLLLTSILCGALIMVIEVLGSRVVGPFFGVSLFIWTSLIAVTLVALAAGYAIGGMLADRRGHSAWLYSIILVAGLLVLLIPGLKEPVLKASVPLGLRMGTFVSTMVLFGPSLFLLGFVSPYLVRLAALEMHNLGRIVGGLYALSTVGSVVGTAATGFFLIAIMGIDAIFYAVGAALIALAAGYFILFERRWWPAVALVLPVIFFPSESLVSKVRADGTRVQELYKVESPYGGVKVVDYSFDDVHIREQMIDGMVQGGIDVNLRLPIYDYAYHLAFLSHALHPAAGRCLVIGVGSGNVPSWYEQQGMVCDLVDIDPYIVHTAREYFGLKVRGETYIEDARYFLANAPERYDHILLDAFSGDITPAHLLSVEALSMVKSRLADRGVLSANIIGSLRREPYMTASVIRTMEQVFDQVEVYPVLSFEKAEDGITNIAIMAYDGPARELDRTDWASFAIHPRIEATVRSQLGTRFHFPEGTPYMILTDDYNPIDHYDSWLRELVRQRILDYVDWDLLLS